MGSDLYFGVRNGPVGLWRTDGTLDGTVRLTTRAMGYDQYEARDNAAGLGKLLIFAGGNDEVWRSDGTPEGTFAIFHQNRFGTTGTPSDFTPSGALMFYAGDSDGSGEEVWRTDGTPEGTVILKDLRPGNDLNNRPRTSLPRDLTDVNGTLFFTALGDGAAGFGWQLWKSDGTAEGTVMVKEIDPDNGSSPARPSGLVNVAGTLFFIAYDLEHGYALWKSDGSSAGTTVVKDLIPGPGSRDRPEFVGAAPPVAAAGGLLFFVRPSQTQWELWKTDGTERGTVLVHALEPGFTAGGMARVGDAAFFSTKVTSELWKTDGTADGTVLVKAYPNVTPAIARLTDVDGTLFFTASDGIAGQELWRSDGTESGTVRESDFTPGPQGFAPTWLTAMPGTGRLFFTVREPVYGDELWTADAPRSPIATVVGRHVFYNRSSFDNNDAEADAADDAAIATDKAALLPGQAASFANVTSYVHGLNGVMLDVDGLPAGSALSPDDFEIGGDGTRVMSVAVRRGAGVNGSDRVTLTWPDYDTPTDPPTLAVGNGWLTVTVKANANTGLATPDVFSFGNLIGEAGDGSAASGWRVTALDLASVKRAMSSPTSIASATDFNRDGRTNALDLAIVRRTLGQVLAPPPRLSDARAASAQRVADDVLA